MTSSESKYLAFMILMVMVLMFFSDNTLHHLVCIVIMLLGWILTVLNRILNELKK